MCVHVCVHELVRWAGEYSLLWSANNTEHKAAPQHKRHSAAIFSNNNLERKFIYKFYLFNFSNRKTSKFHPGTAFPEICCWAAKTSISMFLQHHSTTVKCRNFSITTMDRFKWPTLHIPIVRAAHGSILLRSCCFGCHIDTELIIVIEGLLNCWMVQACFDDSCFPN